MITKGIVEEKVDLYHYRVRLPLLDGVATSKGGRQKKDLLIATVCTIPSTNININVGDVVYVGTESNGESDAMILGYLYCDGSGNTRCDMDLRCLSVLGTTVLSEDTTIGEVTSSEISYLSGVRANIQKQIDYLQSQIDCLNGVPPHSNTNEENK